MLAFLRSLFRIGGWTGIRRRAGGTARKPPADTPKAGLDPESRFLVEVTPTAIVVQRPDGRTESLAFADLGTVIVETNDTGPWGIDVWWFLVSKDRESGCVYPGGATGELETLAALQKLPGFDHDAAIRAATSCSNDRFICWSHLWQGQKGAAPVPPEGGPGAVLPGGTRPGPS